MKKIFVSLLVLILFTGGCASSKIKHHPDEASDRIFPPGLYRHDVTLAVKIPDQGEQKYQFNGVVRLATNEIEVVVLSQFGTTEFKIFEDLATGNVRTEIFRESLKKFEPKLKVYYGVLRLILLAKTNLKSDSTLKGIKLDDHGYPLELETKALEPGAHFSLSHYDKNHIPAEMEITHPQFRVNVKVSGYEI